MPTFVDTPPPLTDRILGADLVLVGTVTGLRETFPAKGFDTPRVSGLFEVVVEEMLYGERDQSPVLIRVLGDGKSEDATWSIDLREGQQHLLLLTRDVAPDLPENVYAPYFASCFAVREGLLKIPADALDETSLDVCGAKDEQVSIDGIRRLIAVVTSKRIERQRAVEEMLPPQLRDLPYPQEKELPGWREDIPVVVRPLAESESGEDVPGAPDEPPSDDGLSPTEAED
jgi:hypothetical protein